MSKAIIVGAGLSGPMLALFLARRGFDVHVYEARDDPRGDSAFEGKSISLTISRRGLDALHRVGLDAAVRSGLCIPLRGRAVHVEGRPVQYIGYGIHSQELLWAVSRVDLTKFLCRAAADEPRVSLHFNQRCVSLDKETGEVTFRDTATGDVHTVAADLVVGADGVHSAVRRFIQHGEFADFSEHYVPWRYKELTIRGDSAALSGMNKHFLHVWPRGQFMMFALPNRNGTFNGVCVLPERGPDSMQQLDSPDAVRDFFRRHFSDVVPRMPDLTEEYFKRPASAFATVRTSLWHHRDKVVLVGDACHTVVPFYGQGMNAAFEDCVVLDTALARNWHNWEAALRTYRDARKRNTDVLADLSIANFDELRDASRLPHFVARKQFYLAMNRTLGENFRPLHALVSHTTVPYAECVEQAQRAERLAKAMGVGAWAWAWTAVSGRATRLKNQLSQPPLADTVLHSADIDSADIDSADLDSEPPRRAT
jgi:kynurenine 3-monooxygenase